MRWWLSLGWRVCSGLTVCNPMDYIDYTCQAPVSMGFSRQEYWSGLPSSSRGPSWPRDCTHVPCVTCTSTWVLYQLSHQKACGWALALSVFISATFFLFVKCDNLGSVPIPVLTVSECPPGKPSSWDAPSCPPPTPGHQELTKGATLQLCQWNSVHCPPIPLLGRAGEPPFYPQL